MSYLLDTSTLLAHFFDESGAAETQAIFDHGRDDVAVSAVSVAEFESRLTQEGIGEDDRLFACLHCFSLLARVLGIQRTNLYRKMRRLNLMRAKTAGRDS